MPSILDDLFSWAKKQGDDHTVSVQVALTANRMRPRNLVTYAEGKLYYSGSNTPQAAASFGTKKGEDLAQYSSDQRVSGSPFNPAKRKRFNLLFERPPALLTGYSVTGWVGSRLSAFNFNVTEDLATAILYGTAAGDFFTISLCDRQSIRIPR